MPTLWAKTARFDSISVGDGLPILVKFDFRPPAHEGVEAPREDPVGPEKLTAYVKELLLKGLPPDNVNHEETMFDTEILIPFLPGDTVSLSGAVVGKWDADGKRAVECHVTVETEDGGETVAIAKVIVSF